MYNTIVKALYYTFVCLSEEIFLVDIHFDGTTKEQKKMLYFFAK